MSSLILPNRPYSSNTIFIAGGTGAIGSEIALLYRKKGWNIFLVARNESKLVELARQLRTISASTRVEIFPCDLRNITQTKAAVDYCKSIFKIITLVISCAGSFEEMDSPISVFNPTIGSKHWAIIEQNVMTCTSPLLRESPHKEGGYLSFTSTFARTLIDWPGLTYFLTWCNAVSGLHEGLFTELRSAHVRVGMITLGLTRSKFGRRLNQILSNGINPILYKDETKWIQPYDVARAVEFMMSAEPINGTVCDLVLQPQTMLERNATFCDHQRVMEMVKSIQLPFQPNVQSVALVTGSGKGIGRGICTLLAKNGFNIVALTRTQHDLDSLQIECESRYGVKFLGISVDVTDKPGLMNAVDKAVKQFGTLSLVVSNAGTNKRRVAPLADMESWNQVMDVDFLAAMNLTRLTLKYLIRHAQQQQQLTNQPSTQYYKPTLCFISSNYVQHKGVKTPGISSYVSAKAATNAFASVVLDEVRDLGVGVSVINPDIVATDLGVKPVKDLAKQGVKELIPKDMLLFPEDIGRAVLFSAQCSPSCVMKEMSLLNMIHTYPAVRSAHEKFLNSLL
jgi:NAD(P)-dependent dehydrogenase (short-subunit alcohol dehydrogenase family)